MSETLLDVLHEHDLELPANAVEQLDAYRQLLWAWNEQLNLTRHTDLQRFVTRDIYDSIQLAEYLQPDEEVLDVGSGGGVPGIVLSVLRPDLSVELSESVGKKARALDDMVAKLGLAIPVHHARAEDVLDDFRYHTLCVRAVSGMSKLLTWFEHKWASFDRLLLIKGPKWVEERGEARHRGLMRDLQLRKLADYETPTTGAQSVVLEVRRRPA